MPPSTIKLIQQFQPSLPTVEIIQGRLLLRADDGTGLKEAVSSAPGVSDNQWHLVEVQQKNQNELQLIVDGRHRDSLKFQLVGSYFVFLKLLLFYGFFIILLLLRLLCYY